MDTKRTCKVNEDIDDLTISIGTFDNYEVLEKCLRSIFDNNSQLKYKVFVVDNDSMDDSAAKIENAFPQAILIRKKAKLGFCGTHNLVISKSQSRYVLILDDDTVILPGTLEKMVAFMDSHMEVGMAGCRTLNPDGTFQKSFGVIPSLKTQFMETFRLSDYWPEELYSKVNTVKEVEWVNGPFMLVRSEVLKEVGAFDEYYYTIVCEADWCYRIRKAGWKVVYVPEAEIIHEGALITESKDILTQMRFYVNVYYFFHKHYSWLSSLMLRPVMMFRAVSRMACFLVLSGLRSDIKEESRKRSRLAWEVMKLSLSPVPYKLPKRLSYPQGLYEEKRA
jgi:GT2 family glycosyltransferase